MEWFSINNMSLCSKNTETLKRLFVSVCAIINLEICMIKKIVIKWKEYITLLPDDYHKKTTDRTQDW